MILKAGQFTFQAEAIGCVYTSSATDEPNDNQMLTVVHLIGRGSFVLSGTDEAEFLAQWAKLATLDQVLAENQAIQQTCNSKPFKLCKPNRLTSKPYKKPATGEF